MIVGVKIGPALDASVRRAAEEAERVGFHSVWLSERVVTPLDKPHPYDPMPDPWIALSYVAAVTERVLLGTSVSMIALRPPVLMARELATLDRLSGGRLIAGVGAGWVAEEFSSTGVRFEDRGGRLSESMRVLRHLWTTPEKAWHGKFFDIPPVGIVKPLTPGGPRIDAGGFTEPGYRRAAKYADGFISVNVADLSQLAALRTHLDELRARYGRTGAFAFLVQSNPPETVEVAQEMARAYRAGRIDGTILTYPDAVPDAFLRARDIVRALVES